MPVPTSHSYKPSGSPSTRPSKATSLQTTTLIPPGKAFSENYNTAAPPLLTPWKHGVPESAVPPQSCQASFGQMLPRSQVSAGIHQKVKVEGDVTQGSFVTPRWFRLLVTKASCSYTHRDSTILAPAASGRLPIRFRSKAPFEVGALGAENEGFWAGPAINPNLRLRSPPELNTSAFEEVR